MKGGPQLTLDPACKLRHEIGIYSIYLIHIYIYDICFQKNIIYIYMIYGFYPTNTHIYSII